MTSLLNPFANWILGDNQTHWQAHVEHDFTNRGSVGIKMATLKAKLKNTLYVEILSDCYGEGGDKFSGLLRYRISGPAIEKNKRLATDLRNCMKLYSPGDECDDEEALTASIRYFKGVCS